MADSHDIPAEILKQCVNAVGYTHGECIRSNAAKTMALVRLAAMTLIAVKNADTAIDNFKKQYEIAKRSMKIAEEQQKQLQEVYWPRELRFLAEFATGKNRDGVEKVEAVETLGRRYGGRLISAVADRFAKKLHETRCDMPRYNTSANRKAMQDIMLARSQAIATARILGRHVAFVEVMAREDQDWNRRMAAVALGRGIMQNVASLMANAAQGMAQSGQAALAGLNSAIGEVGYSFKQAFGAFSGGAGSSAETIRIGQSLAAQGFPQGTGGNSSLNVNMAQPSYTYNNPYYASTSFAQTWAASTNMADSSYNTYESSASRGFDTWTDPGSSMPTSFERINNTDMTHQQLVRTGRVQYKWNDDESGRPMMIEINMDDFPLGLAQEYSSEIRAGVPEQHSVFVNPNPMVLNPVGYTGSGQHNEPYNL